ncbi:MAG TPA: SGNH/GDSL hydrolase family protein [Verrucomicrobiae bacterium]|nr:SGNH/GDSL hydrolase family protein [Verrucomicrobiae bacterium]
MRFATCFAAALLLALAATVCRAQNPLPGLKKYHRVVFVGDSITYLGGYVDDIEAYVLIHDTNSTITILNLGQSSETVSGLSEPNHAGGKYLRPDLKDRLTGIIEKTKPDLIVADYGMNDGIYQPFDEGRFQKFKEGIQSLHNAALRYGIAIVHVTPSPFDPQPIRAKLSPDGAKGYAAPYTNYNETLDRYSQWLVSQRSNHWAVIDVHSQMNLYLAARRGVNPEYALSRDGVHPNATGHWLMAREMLVYWGAPRDISAMDDVEEMLAAHPHGKEILETVTGQEHILRNAWLTEAGHLYPGHVVGLPLPEAEKQAAVLTDKLHTLVQTP